MGQSLDLQEANCENVICRPKNEKSNRHDASEERWCRPLQRRLLIKSVNGRDARPKHDDAESRLSRWNGTAIDDVRRPVAVDDGRAGPI